MIQDRAIVANEHSRVPQTPHAGGSALVKANVSEDAVLGAGLAEGEQFGAPDRDALVRESAEKDVVVGGDRSGQGGPQRESGDVGFREDDEIGAMERGFFNEGDGFLYGFGGVEEDRSDVAGYIDFAYQIFCYSMSSKIGEDGNHLLR